MPGRAFAQNAPDMFKDVPRDHWTYQAVDSLRNKGILIGYPDSYFRGTRTLSRYELAVALDRALQRALGNRQESSLESLPSAKPIAIVDHPEPGKPRFPGLTTEDLGSIRRLITEFRIELASLGNNIQALNRKLEQLARDLSASAPAAESIP